MTLVRVQSTWWTAFAAALGLSGVAGSGRAQQIGDDQAYRLLAPRSMLEASLDRLEKAAFQPGAAAALGRTSEQARSEVALIRARLTDGDFQLGDRILLTVEGEKALSDTFAVGPERAVVLPDIGAVSLQGVLRAELEVSLTRRIEEFLREPVVHARALVRLAVEGEVGKPGYYAVPADAVLSDALMAAGGPTRDAKLPAMRIDRAGKPIWRGDRLRQALAQGRTVDDMNLRDGDQFVVPARRGADPYPAFRLLGAVLGVPIAVYTLTRIF